jgi:hypothetical protein
MAEVLPKSVPLSDEDIVEGKRMLFEAEQDCSLRDWTCEKGLYRFSEETTELGRRQSTTARSCGTHSRAKDNS